MKKVMKNTIKNVSTLSAAIAVAAMSVITVDAATSVTDSFTAQIIIIEDCDIVSAGNLNFGSAGVLAANVDATAALSVQCTNSTSYDIGLNAGANGSVATRQMKSGTALIDYRMYVDSSRSSTWGDTVGTNTKSVTGNGSAQSHTIYGRVPIQATPAAGTYTDTVTVTVTF